MDEVTLRDYFAAKAMQSILASNPIDYSDDAMDDSVGQIDYIVIESYVIADAMLYARGITLKGQQ